MAAPNPNLLIEEFSILHFKIRLLWKSGKIIGNFLLSYMHSGGKFGGKPTILILITTTVKHGRGLIMTLFFSRETKTRYKVDVKMDAA